MQKKDLKKPLGGLNTDDNPSVLPEGDYSDALNLRISSSDEQHGVGLAESLQGEIEILISVAGEFIYYGGAIGGEFIYSGFEEVQIGSQVWMKRNWDASYPGSKAYNDDETNTSIYARLYTHNQAMSSNFCPAGWRVPTIADIDELISYLGGLMLAGGEMKEVGTDHWTAPNTNAVDSNGFRALPGGKFDTLFEMLGTDGFFWLQDDAAPTNPVALAGTEINEDSFIANWGGDDGADGYYLDVATDLAFTAILAGYNNKDAGAAKSLLVSGLNTVTPYYFRVRAYNEIGTSGNSNIETITTIGAEMITDIDGNVYTSVIIGTQEWLVENLKTTKYADGTPIPNLTLDADWVAEDGSVGHDGAYCYYNNDIANKADYGALYDFYAVDNVKGIAPTGWRVPSETDWNTLSTFLGGVDIGGGKLKEEGLAFWDAPNNATNDYGFSARGSGFRNIDGGFLQQGEATYLHSTTKPDANHNLSVNLFNGPVFMNFANYPWGSQISPPYGFSVRCMRDIP